MYVMYIYSIGCSKEHLLRVWDRDIWQTPAMRAFPNKRKTSLCLKKKREKVKHFKAFSGEEWKKEMAAV